MAKSVGKSLNKMEKAYEPSRYENAIYKKWEEAGMFKPNDDEKKFTIAIPPPNVTGTLHLGHAIFLSIQDIMIRWHRMLGDSTLWIPGTDHAAIATETVVLRNLNRKSREEFTREEFLGKCWEWTEKSNATITNQIKRMGSSCDWSREAFTFDKKRNIAVNKIFKMLFEKGLIFRGHRMVNWSIGAQSVLSDDEVNYKDIEGKLYYFKYFINDKEYISVATTRPETMFGDVAVAVNPDDKRYKSLIGKEVKIPFTDRKIPIIADSYVDPKFGTGALKITPAHDPNDFEIGKTHKLDLIQVIGFDGKMVLSEYVPVEYQGLTREECRKKLTDQKIKKEQNYLEKIQSHSHTAGFCYRSDTIIEPMVSKQWFIGVEKEFQDEHTGQKTTLKQQLIDAVENGDVKIIPKKFEKIYFNWVRNLKDWCISRQIWWGHRIPVWYDENEKEYLQNEQKLIFVRHGQSEANFDRIMQGIHDTKLTEKGREQARKCVEKFKSQGITKIICSDLKRAKETAEIIANELNLKIEIWEDLREVNAGNLEKKSFMELFGIKHPSYRQMAESIFQANNSEKLTEVFQRAKKVFDKLSALKEEKILIISHGMFMSTFFASQEEVKPENFYEFLENWRMSNTDTRTIINLKNPEIPGLHQDEDTLDTWFSSALWPFSILGWPDTENPDFKKFYPTSVLETGHDIIFFWVARMIMFGKFATGQYPFHTVYLHGMVNDALGRKMSKSRPETCIDPLDMIEKYGTDALRLSLIIGSSPGNNVNLGEEKIAGCRNLCNKLWNISRFILSIENLPKTDEPITPKTDLQKWLNWKLNVLIKQTTGDLKKYQFGIAAEKLWNFTWDEFADWALEAAKAENLPETNSLLLQTLKSLLKLWHPFIPFVTEKIWEELGEDNFLITAKWPKEIKKSGTEINFEIIKEAVSKIRSLRAEKKVEPGKKITAIINGEKSEIMTNNQSIVKFLARIEELRINEKIENDKYISEYLPGMEIHLPIADLINLTAEKDRIAKEILNTKNIVEGLNRKLSNKDFVQKAPKVLVDKTKMQLEEAKEKITKLEKEILNYK